MCGQGDIEIIGEGREKHTIEELKQMCLDNGYSAVVVGEFGHAALKTFNYQLSKDHCKPTHYDCTIHINKKSACKGMPGMDGIGDLVFEDENWEGYRNIDMEGQGDKDIVHNWEAKHSLEEIKQMVIDKNYSAFTVSAGKPSFEHAALKDFPFKLTKDHCRPCDSHPRIIYILKHNEAKKSTEKAISPMPYRPDMDL